MVTDIRSGTQDAAQPVGVKTDKRRSVGNRPPIGVDTRAGHDGDISPSARTFPVLEAQTQGDGRTGGAHRLRRDLAALAISDRAQFARPVDQFQAPGS